MRSQIRGRDNSDKYLGYLGSYPEEKESMIRQSRNELDEIFKPKTIGLVGLHNIGNTCFMYPSYYPGTRSFSVCSTYPNSTTISLTTNTSKKLTGTAESPWPTLAWFNSSKLAPIGLKHPQKLKEPLPLAKTSSQATDNKTHRSSS